jgi:EamA domain-containing membrane protein RarD
MSEHAAYEPAQEPATRRGPGRVLIAVYAVFAIGATTRALYQLVTRFDEAPVAYLLSLFAAVVYVVITVALIKGTPAARRVARIGIVVELVGVLVVGTISLLLPDYFPRATVWSSYGLGYLLIPLILPILGLWFLRSTESH